MNYSFSIIIVTWNGLHHLKKFLPSVADTTYENFEIIIADNASDDGTAEWIRREYPVCKIITFDSNFGYCGGNNRAVSYANGEILLFLNNDVRVEKDWLTHLNTSFANPDTHIVQPKMLSYNHPEQFEYAGAAGGMIDRLGYPFCRGRLFEYLEQDNNQYDDESVIFWASGAAMAIRKDTFSELGGFDEDFEFHMEEIDLCWRAWSHGYKSVFQYKSVVYHLGGGSLPMGNPRKVFYNYRNSLLMLTKNLNSNLFFNILTRLCLDGIAGLRSLLLLKPKETWSIIKAHFSFYRGLSKTLIKRKKIQKDFATSSQIKAPIYERLIIIDVFLKGIKKYSDLGTEEFISGTEHIQNE